jgi:EmrB/QacA subfamily drug resistance transporter
VNPARPGTSRWLVLVLVCLAQFMVVLDATVVNVALPSIQRDLDFSSGNLQWVVNGYTLVFGGFLLLGGRAADLLGRRRLFLAGVAVFTLASLLSGLAQSSEMLIAARALQGLGGALVSPAALSIITTTFADGTDRTRALGVWGAIAGGGGAFGLLLGGLLTQTLSWEWVFFVNVPIGLATIIASARFVPESRSEAQTRGFDLAGAASVTSGLVILTYAIVKAQDFGWGDPRTLGLGALAAALLVAFVFVERRSRSPLVRLDILRTRSLAATNGVMLLVAGGLFSMFFFGGLYLQQVLGYDPLEAGLAFLPMTAGIVAGSVLSQRLIPRFGVKNVLLGGLTTAAAGLALMTRVAPDSDYLTVVLPAFALMAIGMGNAFVPLTLTATTNVAAQDQGLASGLFNTAQQVGGALGLAILSTLAANRTAGASSAGALVDGFHIAFTAGAILIGVGVLIAAVALRRRDVASIDAADGVPVPA